MSRVLVLSENQYAMHVYLTDTAIEKRHWIFRSVQFTVLQPAKSVCIEFHVDRFVPSHLHHLISNWVATLTPNIIIIPVLFRPNDFELKFALGISAFVTKRVQNTIVRLIGIAWVNAEPFASRGHSISLAKKQSPSFRPVTCEAAWTSHTLVILHIVGCRTNHSCRVYVVTS